MIASHGLLVGLQVFHVAFLALHDWIPLGTLNDVGAVKRTIPKSKMALGTLLSTAPFAFGLVESVLHAQAYPHWLVQLLWWSYGLLFAGELQAWWVPYLFGAKVGLAERYALMFGKTSAFLPPRHGIQPNTLHVMLHAMTVLTLVVLAITPAGQGLS